MLSLFIPFNYELSQAVHVKMTKSFFFPSPVFPFFLLSLTPFSGCMIHSTIFDVKKKTKSQKSIGGNKISKIRIHRVETSNK